MEISGLGMFAVWLFSLLAIGMIVLLIGRILCSLPRTPLSKDDGTVFKTNCSAKVDSIAANFPFAEVTLKNTLLTVKITRKYEFQVSDIVTMSLKTKWGLKSLNIRVKGDEFHHILISGCNCTLLHSLIQARLRKTDESSFAARTSRAN